MLKKKGYKIHIFFLWIPTSQLAILRVKERVEQGGHNVPTENVRRRFERSIEKFFKEYRFLSDKWVLFNNEGLIPQMIAQKQNNHIDVANRILFKKITNKVGVKL